MHVRFHARSNVNLRWLKISLRFMAGLLLVVAAFIFFHGGLSFRSETQASENTYVIRHTVILGRSAIFPAAVGVLLFASSLFVPSKRA
jgi:hypothetical protein